MNNDTLTHATAVVLQHGELADPPVQARETASTICDGRESEANRPPPDPCAPDHGLARPSRALPVAGARLSRTGNKAAAANDCLRCRRLPLRRSAARGHVTAAAHQPLRAAARELEIGWDIPPAGRPLGSAWRRGHELGGAAVHGFFSSPQLVRVPGASAGLSVCQWKPRAWSPNEASST